MKKTKIIAYLIPIIIVFIVVSSIYYGNYTDTVEIIESEYISKLELIEQSIYNETKYTSVINKIAEQTIQYDMENNSKIMLNKYQEDPDMLNWDLEEMKKQFGKMDIYIIDEELNVIVSTIKEEIGLNFSGYNDFSKLMRKRLEGNEFECDTINFSILTGELKKYSYMPVFVN